MTTMAHEINRNSKECNIILLELITQENSEECNNN